MNLSFIRQQKGKLILMIPSQVSDVLPKNSKYVESITTFAGSSSFFKRIIELINVESELSVICHGDCWTNNFLYRYNEEGHVVEVSCISIS